MGDGTKIEWAEATWTPIRARNIQTGKVGWYCVHASDGCANCYAEILNRRLGTGIDYRAQDLGQVEIYLDEKILTQPLRWRRPRRIFVCSMTDLFGEFVPDEMIDRVFAVMALCPQHAFLLLTKRAERMRDYICSQRDNPRYLRFNEQELSWTMYEGGVPKHIWLGVSVEDHRRADERIPLLLATPAAVRWISAEPLLGSIDLTAIPRKRALGYCRPLDGRFRRLDWVVVGGESGPGARPMRPAWARALRDQCTAAGVPFFFKQWGAWLPGQNDPHPSEIRRIAHWQDGGWGARTTARPAKNYIMWDDDGTLHPGGSLESGEHFAVKAWASRVGKKRSGRLLDGREHNEYPEPHQ